MSNDGTVPLHGTRPSAALPAMHRGPAAFAPHMPDSRFRTSDFDAGPGLASPQDTSAPDPLHLGGDGPLADVLVVEDSAIARRFLQVRLQRLGYRVHLACDADQALEVLARERFGLVFLDVVLGPAGSLDGLWLCQQLKRDRESAAAGSPKVVIVTGLGSESDRVRGALAGCDAYLRKPLSEPDFLQVLRTLDPGFAARQQASG